MIVRSLACFDSSLPEDAFEDEEGRFLQPPGKSAALAISEIFSAVGCVVDDGPEPENDFSWGYAMTYRGRNYYAVLNSADRYYLTLRHSRWIDKLLGRQPRRYLELLRAVASALAADPRFSDIRWLFDWEARSAGRSAGADFPVIEAVREK